MRVPRRCLRGAPVALAAIVSPGVVWAQTIADPAPPDEDNLRVSVGTTYADGRYGQTARTDVVTVPLSLKYTHSRFSVKLTVPYVHIHGPGTLLDGTGSGASGSGGSSGSGSGVVSEPETEIETETETEATTGGTITGTGETEGETIPGTIPGTGTTGPVVPMPAPMRNRGGLGDTTVTMAYSLPLGDAFALESRGRIKLPTASSRKGIGTGKVDVTLAADLVGSFGPTTVYAGARRRFLGRSVRFPVRDGWGFGGGVSHAVSSVVTIGTDYDWLQSAIPGRGPISEASLWISAKLTRQIRLQAYGGTGFSSRSADILGGLTLVWRP